MQQKAPGPNDRHFVLDEKTNQLVQMPGLGPDEPSFKEHAAASAAADEHRRRQEALERAAADIRQEALALEARQAEAEKVAEQRAAEHDRVMKELEQLKAELEAERQAIANAGPGAVKGHPEGKKDSAGQ